MMRAWGACALSGSFGHDGGEGMARALGVGKVGGGEGTERVWLGGVWPSQWMERKELSIGSGV